MLCAHQAVRERAVPPGPGEITAAKVQDCKASVKALMAMLAAGITSRQIMTKKAFENAITVMFALGGSTNAVLHLLALARDADVDLTVDDFNRPPCWHSALKIFVSLSGILDCVCQSWRSNPYHSKPGTTWAILVRGRCGPHWGAAGDTEGVLYLVELLTIAGSCVLYVARLWSGGGHSPSWVTLKVILPGDLSGLILY